jgi:hypothetical protein
MSLQSSQIATGFALLSLAATQTRLAVQYLAWVKDGGKSVDCHRQSYERLKRDARRHIGMARVYRHPVIPG